MSTNFPTSLDSFAARSSGQVVASAHINNLQDAVAALEAKVGANSSAVTTSLDYKVTNFAGDLGPGLHGYNGWTLDPNLINGSAYTPTAGVLNVVKVPVVTAGSVQHIDFYYTGVTSTTVTWALYTTAGALLSQSSAVSTATSGANQGTATLGAAQSLTAATYYYVAFWGLGGTASIFGNNLGAQNNGLGNINLSAANSRYATTSDTGLTTTAPSTLGTKTARTGAIPWVALRA